MTMSQIIVVWSNRQNSNIVKKNTAVLKWHKTLLPESMYPIEQAPPYTSVNFM